MKISIDALRQMAKNGDVTYQILRYYRDDFCNEESPLYHELHRIQTFGFIAASLDALRSMQPHEMYRDPQPDERCHLQINGVCKIQLGHYTLGQRLSRAMRWAQKAGLPIQQIASEFHLEEMLKVTPEPEPENIPFGY